MTKPIFPYTSNRLKKFFKYLCVPMPLSSGKDYFKHRFFFRVEICHANTGAYIDSYEEGNDRNLY